MKSVFKTLDATGREKWFSMGGAPRNMRPSLQPENQMQWYDDQERYHPIGQWWIDILMKELQARKQKSALLS